MVFVGREKEIRAITGALGRGENVVLTGKFGIGRTALVRHIAAVNQRRWRFVFVDFSRTANQACQQMIQELFPRIQEESMHYRRARATLAKEDLTDKRRPVLVLDNMPKLPAPKLNFIRYLVSAKRFLFIPIVEYFVPEEHVLRLRGALFPAAMITLERLNETDALDFFRRYSEKHAFRWDDTRIRNLAVATHGYPLIMREVVEREVRRSVKTGNSC